MVGVPAAARTRHRPTANAAQEHLPQHAGRPRCRRLTRGHAGWCQRGFQRRCRGLALHLPGCCCPTGLPAAPASEGAMICGVLPDAARTAAHTCRPTQQDLLRILATTRRKYFPFLHVVQAPEGSSGRGHAGGRRPPTLLQKALTPSPQVAALASQGASLHREFHSDTPAAWHRSSYH